MSARPVTCALLIGAIACCVALLSGCALSSTTNTSPPPGTLRWTFDTHGYPGKPVFANGAIYVHAFVERGTNNNGPNTELYALDANTGHQRWGFPLFDNYDTSPVIADGLVFVGGSDGLGDGVLFVLDAATGRPHWTTGIAVGGTGASSPAVASGVVYAPSDGGNVSAIDIKTGSEIWPFFAFDHFFESPFVSNGIVYIGGAGGLYAIDAKSGLSKWIDYVGPGGVTKMLVVNGIAYIETSDGSHNFVLAYQATSGQRLWAFSPGDSEPLDSLLTVNGDSVFFTYNDQVYALNAGTGRLRWAINVGPGSIAGDGAAGVTSPIVANGVVYVSGPDIKIHTSKLFALDAATGKQRWAISVSGREYGYLAVANGLLYASSGDDGKIYAYDI